MLNNRRIRVTRQNSLKGALLGTDFPFKKQQHLDAYLDMFRTLFNDSDGIHRANATALDLAYLASGRLDGFWGIGLHEWDMAAGVLLVKEAGGVVTDFSFGDQFLASGNIISGNPKMHQILYQSIEPHVTERLK